MPGTFDVHYDNVITAIADGQIIPFFGAGVNLCGRPDSVTWSRGCPHLPSGSELAEHLAKKYHYSWSDKQDLARVSQYAAIIMGPGSLNEELHKLFDADYKPTRLHKFFAALPATLREKGYRPGQLLIITTNYDDLLEIAFKEAGEEFDLVSYEAEDKQLRGKFWHTPPGGEARIIEKPNSYRGLSLEQRSIILKIHGAIDRENPDRDSFVITEDHYIDYLTRIDISKFVPATVAAKLRNSHFLFLGYRLRDWNLRAILYSIWAEQKRFWRYWAILSNSEQFDRLFWQSRNVDILEILLEEYIARLDERVKALPRAEV